MAHGFLTPQDVSGESPIFGKVWDWLWKDRDEQEKENKKRHEEVTDKLDDIQEAVIRDVTKKQAPAYKMLRGNEPKALPSGTKALPPGGPRLPGSPDGPTKGGAITNLSGDGGINAETFFKRAQSGVSADGTYMTNAQRKEAFIKSRQERVKESVASAAAVSKSPEISPDSGADIVAAVSKNTEAILGLVKVTKEQTSNDTKLSEKTALTQEKLMGRQRAAAEERSLEEGKDMSGFLTPTMKKIEQQAKGGSGGGMGGYDANMDRMTRAQEMLDIGSDIMDMRKGRVRRITQGRDGRTPRQRLRDIKARRPGGGVKPRGKLGSLSRLGGAASKGGALGGLGGGLKGAARGLGKSGPLALLTAGLEFGDRMSSGQNAFQAGAGTAGSVGGGLAGAAAGAAIGSIVPGVGTVIGGLIGGMLGSMAGGGVADMATGANKIPSGAGGMLSSGPMGGYLSMLHGTELTLSGNNAKETKNIGEALGEGMIMASLGPLNPKVLELSAKGMKHYYENMGGKDMMASIFEGVTDALGAVGNMLGNVANSLLGGAANAAGMPGGPVTGGNEDNMLAAYLSTLEGGSGQNAADAMQVMLNRAAQNHSGYGSNVAEQAMAQGQFTPFSVAIHGRGLDQAANRAYGHIADMLGNSPEERKAKLRQIVRTEGFAGLDRVFSQSKAQHASAVLQDFQQGGPMSALARKDVKGRAYFKGQSDLKNMKAGDLYRGTGGNYFHDDRDLSKLTVGMLQNAAPTAGTGTAGSKLEEDILAFRQARTQFGVSGQRQATDSSFNLAIRELRGAAGGSSINPLADDLSYQDVHRGRAHKEGYGFDVPIANATQSKFVIDFFRSRGYETIHGRAEDPTGGHDHHVHVQAPHNRKDEFLASRGQNPRGTGQPFNIPGAPELTNILNMNAPAATPPAAQMFQTSGMPALAAAASPTPATPTPVAAAPAAANTGTGVMQASAQTSGPVFQQPVTVVNNYNVAGAGGGGDVIPNTLGAGVSMGQMGLDSFSQLKIRSLG